MSGGHHGTSRPIPRTKAVAKCRATGRGLSRMRALRVGVPDAAAAPDPTITKNGDRRAMATGSGPTFEQKMDRLLAAAHDCGAWLRFRTVRPETNHSSASGDVAHDELILPLPDGRRERFNLGVGGIDRLVGELPAVFLSPYCPEKLEDDSVEGNGETMI